MRPNAEYTHTFKNSQPVMIPIVKSAAATRFGGLYGNLSKKLPPRGFLGSTLSGFDSAPPNVGPKIAPIVYTRGMILKALGCSSFHGHNSATVVLNMPTFPFPSPCRARAVMAIGSEVEKPNNSMVIIVLHKPIKMIGFLPKRSDAAPHGMPVRACEMENTAEVKPAQRAMSVSGTPKDSIISGMYGETDVKAMGSAKRHIAVEVVSLWNSLT